MKNIIKSLNYFLSLFFILVPISKMLKVEQFRPILDINNVIPEPPRIEVPFDVLAETNEVNPLIK